MTPFHVVIDACCLGRRKTGNETYIRGLLKGLEEVLKDGSRNLIPEREAKAPASGLQSQHSDFPPAFTILTTEAHQGERQECFNWVDIPLGNFLTRNFLTIPRLLKDLKADLYHGSYWSRFWAQPCPTVLMVHDLSFVSFPEGFHKHEQFIYANLVRLCAKSAAHILTVSEFSKREIMTHWNIPANKITVTYDGIDEVFKPKKDDLRLDGENGKPEAGDLKPETGNLKKPEGDCGKVDSAELPVGNSQRHSQVSSFNSHLCPYILYVGNLHPRKNLVRLLEAFVLLKKEHDFPHILKIVGQKAWLSGEIFDAVRQSGLEKAVEFTGYVEQNQLVSLYQQAALTVYPSLYEGFGLPPMEAMACGCPVVTSTSTSLPEVTGGSALLVDPTSVREIADGLAEVLANDDLRRRLAESGPRRTGEFTWVACAEATLSAYRHVSGGAR